MTEQQPLSALHIVVTRPREQAAQLARNIERAGGKAILFPLLEITPPADAQPLHAVLQRLAEFDLAIFISPNAVRYGMQAAGTLPPQLKVATVGQGSAHALQDLGVRGIIAPQDRFDSEALLALPELQQVAGWRVAIFRGDGGRELLGDTLRARGAVVEYVTCYQRSRPQQDVSVLDGAIDALTVTSSEALGYLWDMLDAAARRRFSGIPLFVPHPRIAAAARQLGWREVVLAAGGDDGLLAGLIAWAKHREQS
ncbi:MAG: uroporphyrinogen-III synthase [Sideroxydans sp.]|nr:uroporphyrinogen-III synthase [Sideroxydans sp.]